MRVEPYLYFDGRCDEAIELYQRTLGAQVAARVSFKDGGVPLSANNENKVMHAELRIGESVVLASDGQCRGQPNFQGFSLAVSVTEDAEAERLFNALASGGRVQLPLASTPFASRFGMVADSFGVLWTIVSQRRGG